MKVNVNVKDVNSCEKVLTIDVSAEVVVQEFNSFYDSVAKRAKIPGFRPGHAPRHVIALHFREEARQEVWKRLVAQGFRDAIQQEEIPVIGYPKIENVEFDETRLKFKAHVEMRPKIKIDKYTDLLLKRETARVGETEIDEVLKRLQESHAKFQVVEGREARSGDFLIADYQLQVEDREVEKRNGEWIEIREKDYLEGFSKQLLGVRPGEARKVAITFPIDYNRGEFAGKKGEFSITIHEIKEKVLAALDDEFAKELGEHGTLAELRDAIKGDLENHKKLEAERKLERDILDQLIEKSRFEIPPGVTERRLNALVEESVQSLVQRGVKEEDALRQKEEIKKGLAHEAQRQVRISFLLDEIATREHIEAQEEDWVRRYQSIAERVRRPLEEVKAYYAQDENRRESLAQQIIVEKTIQWIKDRAIIEEK